MDDIAPNLLKEIQKDFSDMFAANATIKRLYNAISEGKATYKEANEFAVTTGQVLSDAITLNLSEDVLPNGRMYVNIAKKILTPTMGNNYKLISEATGQIQQSLNDSAGLRIKAYTPTQNTDRVMGLAYKAGNYDSYNDAEWCFKEPIVNAAQSVVDDFVRVNAKLQSQMGLSPKIVRTATFGCCKWCAALAGTYNYEDAPDDVYRRHKNCNCIVEFHSGTGKVQNVHSKTWRDEKEIENRRLLSQGEVDKIKSDNTERWLSKEFGKIQGEHTYKDDVKAANPNFLKNFLYQRNCQRCVQTYEYRRRGFNVEAKLKGAKNEKIQWGNECFIDKNGNTPGYTYAQSEKEVKEELTNAPNGARYIIYIQWQRPQNPAHVFIAEKENGIIHYVDPQSGAVDVSDYFKEGVENGFGFLRIDDKGLTSNKNLIKKTMKRGA